MVPFPSSRSVFGILLISFGLWAVVALAQDSSQKPADSGAQDAASSATQTDQSAASSDAAKGQPAQAQPSGDATDPLKRQIDPIDCVQHRPHQMILRQPLHQRRRHQQQLLALARNEIMGHAGIFVNASDA